MAKLTKLVTECEFCGRQIDLTSPPLDEYYRNGRIDIEEGSTVLLDRPKSESSHAASIDGLYCGLQCLIDHIRAIRKGKKISTAK